MAEIVAYYEIPKDYRYRVGEWNPYSIGGHDPDVTQLAMSITSIVRENYPINGVPPILVKQLEILQQEATAMEQTIVAILSQVCVDELKDLRSEGKV